MASLTISDLRPAGSDLFQDSESFLHELTEQEVGDVLGGRPWHIHVLWTVLCVSVGENLPSS